MHKLTNIEAQRVIAVLSNNIDQLNLLSYTPVRAELALLEELNESDNQNIVSSLQRQWQIEETSLMLNTQELSSGGTGGKKNVLPIKPSKNFQTGNSGNNNYGMSTDEVYQQLYHSTRNLCRMLKKNDSVTSTLKDLFESERSPQFIQFIHYLDILKKVTFRRLSTPVEEEIHNQNLIRELTEKQKKSQDQMEDLQENLALQRQENDRELSILCNILTKLQAELNDLTQNTDHEMEVIYKEMRATVDKSTQEFTTKKQDLLQRISKEVPRMAKEVEENKQREMVLRKKKTKAELELQQKIEKYDEGMTRKMKEMKELKEIAAQEELELKELQEYFDRVEANNEQIRREEDILNKVAAIEAKADKILRDAAKSISTNYWKVLRKREEQLANSKKGKKKKKK